MSRPVAKFLLLSLSSVLLFANLACQGPCRTLAERICSCEPNVRAEQSCIQEINQAGQQANRMPGTEEDAVCSELLDSCDCAALQRQDFAACGLSKPNSSTPQ